MKFESKPRWPWYIRAAVPMPIVDIVTWISISLAIGLAGAILMEDLTPFFISTVVGIATVLYFGRFFSIFQIYIRDVESLEAAINLLNSATDLTGNEQENCWSPKSLTFLRSRYDSIYIVEIRNGWLIIGRRISITKLANALNFA